MGMTQTESRSLIHAMVSSTAKAAREFQTGYAYGGGVEYALLTPGVYRAFSSGTVTLRLEYLHYAIGNSNFNIDRSFRLYDFTTRVRHEGDIARVGANYKF